MPDYHFLNGTFRSDLSLPELTPARGLAVCWQLTRSETLAPALNPVMLGEEPVEPGVRVTLVHHEQGLRLSFDDTGVFDISADGAEIAWRPPSAPDLNAVRKDILGRVISVALHQQGLLALHGSAVELGGRAIAFLAPKFHGKSTTAAALVERGARLLADDLVVVSCTEPLTVLPSVPVVQLWEDSARSLSRGSLAAPDLQVGPKIQRRWTEASQHAFEPAPLGGIYLLAPMRPGDSAGVARHALSTVEATLALLGQAKIGALLGKKERANLLTRCGIVADALPVFRLDVPRDFGRLGELASVMETWHSDGAVPSGPA